MATKKKAGGGNRVAPIEASYSRVEWLDVLKSSLLRGLDFEPAEATVDAAIQQSIEGRLEYCRSVGKMDQGPPPSVERRLKKANARALHRASLIIEQNNRPPSTFTSAARVMRDVRRAPRLSADRPPLGATPADLDAITETLAFLRRLADELLHEPSDAERIFSSASDPPKKKLFVWKLAIEWSKVRRQPIGAAPIGSADTPSPILAFVIDVCARVDDLPKPPGLSPETLRRLATRLCGAARKYGDDFISDYVQPLAKKSADEL